MAVDAAGVRHVYETLRMAEGKPLSIVAGFCWRYHPNIRAAYRKVMVEGAIGEITGVYATYNSGHSKPHIDKSKRTPGMSDVEWQIRNWYNYNWLGGSGLVEQAVHSRSTRSAGSWATPARTAASRDRRPGRSPGRRRKHLRPLPRRLRVSQQRLVSPWQPEKTEGCFNENADYVRGTEGTLVIGRRSRSLHRGQERARRSGRLAYRGTRKSPTCIRSNTTNSLRASEVGTTSTTGRA